MGQYFMIYNYTKKQKIYAGKFNDKWEYYIEALDWNVGDDIVAYGDYGKVLKYKIDESQPETANDEEWAFCIYAAKKLKVDPEDLWVEYLYEDSFPEGEIVTVFIPHHISETLKE